MDLTRLKRFLRYPFWENRERCWPLIPGPYPQLGPLQSRQGALAVSNFPNGAAVNAVPAAPNRGLIGLQLNWTDAPLLWYDAIEIAVYIGGDAIEPGYVSSVPNAENGKNNIQVVLGDTAGDVAVKVANAIDFVFVAGGGAQWLAQHGRLAFNDPQTQLNIISPRTAQTLALQTFSGSMSGLTSVQIAASIVPFIYAGLRPGPQVIHGNRFAGFAPPHGE